MSDTNKPWYAKFEAAATREMFSDWWLQVKAKLTPSDYTREAFSTVSRGYVIWMAFIILINLFSGLDSIFREQEYNEGFLYILISGLFGIMFMDRLTLNMAERIIERLLGVTKDQHRMLSEILTDAEAGEFD